MPSTHFKSQAWTAHICTQHCGEGGCFSRGRVVSLRLTGWPGELQVQRESISKTNGKYRGRYPMLTYASTCTQHTSMRMCIYITMQQCSHMHVCTCTCMQTHFLKRKQQGTTVRHKQKALQSPEIVLHNSVPQLQRRPLGVCQQSKGSEKHLPMSERGPRQKARREPQYSTNQEAQLFYTAWSRRQRQLWPLLLSQQITYLLVLVLPDLR